MLDTSSLGTFGQVDTPAGPIRYREEVIADAGAFIPEDRPRELAEVFRAFLVEVPR